MTKQAVFTMKLDQELREDFMAEASALDRPASQVARELMRAFIDRQRQERDYKQFLQGKVDAARESVRSDRGRSHDEVEADFEARRAGAERR